MGRRFRHVPAVVLMESCSDDDDEQIVTPSKPIARSQTARATRAPITPAKQNQKPTVEELPRLESSDDEDDDFQPEIEECDSDDDEEDDDVDSDDQEDDNDDEGSDDAEEKEDDGDDDDEIEDMSDDNREGHQSTLARNWINEDDDDDDDDLVARSEAIDRQKAMDEDDADAELQVNLSAGAQEGFTLPSEHDDNLLASPDLVMLKQRINKVLYVLADLKNQRQQGVSRSDYVDSLRRDLVLYYGYNSDLIDRFLEMFSPAECVEFLEANATKRPMCIRANTLKCRRRDLAQALINRGVNLDPLADWSKVGLTISSSQVPVAATPEYLAGHYMLQSPSSFLPVMALAPKEKETVLDMCSAPGGKTTYLAALMKNTGVVIANDVNKERLKATIGNVHRLGAQNVVVVNYDGRKLPQHFSNVDRILLDAPCSGLGVISKDESIKLTKTSDDIVKCAKLQKELILSGIDMLKVGGHLVYSTCSIAVEENEAVVQYALNKRHVKIVDTGIEFGRPGYKRIGAKHIFNPNMELSRRVYPHVHNMDGFFVAKLVKLQDGHRKYADESEAETRQKRPSTEPEEIVEVTVEGDAPVEDQAAAESSSDEREAEDPEPVPASEPEDAVEKEVLSKRAQISIKKRAKKQQLKSSKISAKRRKQ